MEDVPNEPYEPSEADDDRFPREASEIEANELDGALRGLRLLGGDPFLSMQAFNIAMIDKWLLGLETEARSSLAADERFDFASALFMNAQSQMWMFALYELLRTWRDRAKKTVTTARSGGLTSRIDHLRRDQGFVHLGNISLARQLEEIRDDPSIVSSIDDDLKRTHVTFYQLEFLRVALAKHEVRKRRNSMAYAPGYGRIDRWTGSMSYQLSTGKVILGEVTRRGFGDGLRNLIVDSSVPTDENLASFDEFLRAGDHDPFEA